MDSMSWFVHVKNVFLLYRNDTIYNDLSIMNLIILKIL